MSTMLENDAHRGHGILSHAERPAQALGSCGAHSEPGTRYPVGAATGLATSVIGFGNPCTGSADVQESWLESHPNARTIPAVIPVVLFHGAHGWTAPREFGELFDLPESARVASAGLLPGFRFLLDDLTHVSDDALRGRAMAALPTLVLLAMKHGRVDVESALTGWLDH